ncbi:MAG: hypothetical protein IT561_27195 [Alphaproteobacteria bacterium]|nr:hypothetical protein [Alphaproteobacteria bacterium]
MRLGELAHARRNTRRLLAAGGREHGAAHYPLLVLLHAVWLAALAWSATSAAHIHWPWLAVAVAAMLLRLWAVASLGPRWTTRVIVLPEAPLVVRGPYRLTRHPNYLAVAVEMYALAFAVDAVPAGLVLGTLNLPLLAWRIRAEDRALGRAAPGAIRRG